MSQLSPELVQILQAIQSANYVQGALLALVAYEFVTTFDEEVAAVWSQKLTAASILLLCIRWLMLVNPLLSTLPGTRTSCAPLVALTSVSFFAVTFLISLVSALRVYALCQGSRVTYIIPGLVLILGTVPIGTNIFAWVHSVLVYDTIPFIGTVCNRYIEVSPRLNTALLFFTRSSAIAADVLVLAVTWIKSFTQAREMRRLRLPSSLASVLLRDGTTYFVTLLAIDVLLLLTYTASSASVGSDAANFLQSMPPVLVQRFMLNLRQLRPGRGARADTSTALGTQQLSRFSVAFRMPSDFLGNIGEPLEHSTIGVDATWAMEDSVTGPDDSSNEAGVPYTVDATGVVASSCSITERCEPAESHV